MHVTWIVPAAVEQLTDGRLTSTMASIRYRVLYAAEYLAAAGHRVDLIQPGIDPEAAELAEPLGADVVVVSKGIAAGSLELARRAKRFGTPVLADFCDDHFTTPYRNLYLELCELADALVASTPTMGEIIARHTGRTSTVIGDPYEALAGTARFQPARQRIELLWFGHPTNFDTIAAMVPQLVAFARRRPVRLHVVSQNAGNMAEALEQLAKQHAPAVETRFTPWSVDATWQALASCDVVLIPSLPHDTKQVKSPNRLVESLRCGRFVCAYPLPSYQLFKDCAWLGTDIMAGVDWALTHEHAAEERIRAGQQLVERDHAPAVLARRWEECLAGQIAQYPCR